MEFNEKAGKYLLETIDDILQAIGVPFFLIQGTALGAFRDGRFVTGERDIDIGVLIEHFRMDAHKICAGLVEKNIEIETWHRHYPFPYCHTIVAYIQGAKADIVGFHLNAKDKERYTASPLDPINVLEPYCIVHPRALLEHYTPIEFYGREYNIPHRIERYLEREYGPEWKRPCPDDHISRTRIYNYLRDRGIVV